MKIKAITNTIGRFAGRTGLMVRKHSPEILLVGGIVGVVTSTVMACKATTKAESILDETRENLETVKTVRNTTDLEKYSAMDYRKDLTLVYGQSAVGFLKVYGPALTLGIASIGCILGAHGIMKKRNLALMAAYKTVEQSFADYRKRVVAELGEEKDRQFKYGIVKKNFTVTELDADGNEVSVEKTIDVIDPNGISQYARFFDELSPSWDKNPEYNLTFLKCQQSFANDKLKATGHLFLNEVYDMLGIPRSREGAIVGWVLGEGDDFVDFGIYNADDAKTRQFVNGVEKAILLDFNVDGVIYDLI